jgi:DNA-binding CsgD family transcriptional regulator
MSPPKSADQNADARRELPSHATSRNETGRTPSVNSANGAVRALLSRRARERSVMLRWNGYTLILAYAILAAITILAIRAAGPLLLAGVAVFGLAMIWTLSRFQAKKIEGQLLEDELRVYTDLLTGPAQDRPSRGIPPAPGGRTESPLTGREMQVLRLVAAGKSNKETASALHISDQTVKNHLSHIFVKLHVGDRTSAALLAIRHDWITGTILDRPDQEGLE